MSIDDLERELAGRVVESICVEASRSVEALFGTAESMQPEWGLDGRASGVQWPPAGLVAAERGWHRHPASLAAERFDDVRR